MDSSPARRDCIWKSRRDRSTPLSRYRCHRSSGKFCRCGASKVARGPKNSDDCLGGSYRGWTGISGRWNSEDLQDRRQMSLVEERNVKICLETGAFPPGAGDAPSTLPYPDTQRLAELLSDRRVRRFLPSNLQQAIPSNDASQAGVTRDRLEGIRDMLLKSRFASFGFLFCYCCHGPLFFEKASTRPAS